MSATAKMRRRSKRPPQPGQPIVSAGLPRKTLTRLRFLSRVTGRSVSDLVRAGLDRELTAELHRIGQQQTAPTGADVNDRRKRE